MENNGEDSKNESKKNTSEVRDQKKRDKERNKFTHNRSVSFSSFTSSKLIEKRPKFNDEKNSKEIQQNADEIYKQDQIKKKKNEVQKEKQIKKDYNNKSDKNTNEDQIFKKKIKQEKSETQNSKKEQSIEDKRNDIKKIKKFSILNKKKEQQNIPLLKIASIPQYKLPKQSSAPELPTINKIDNDNPFELEGIKGPFYEINIKELKPNTDNIPITDTIISPTREASKSERNIEIRRRSSAPITTSELVKMKPRSTSTNFFSNFITKMSPKREEDENEVEKEKFKLVKSASQISIFEANDKNSSESSSAELSSISDDSSSSKLFKSEMDSESTSDSFCEEKELLKKVKCGIWWDSMPKNKKDFKNLLKLKLLYFFYKNQEKKISYIDQNKKFHEELPYVNKDHEIYNPHLSIIQYMIIESIIKNDDSRIFQYFLTVTNLMKKMKSRSFAPNDSKKILDFSIIEYFLIVKYITLDNPKIENINLDYFYPDKFFICPVPFGVFNKFTIYPITINNSILEITFPKIDIPPFKYKDFVELFKYGKFRQTLKKSYYIDFFIFDIIDFNLLSFESRK